MITRLLIAAGLVVLACLAQGARSGSDTYWETLYPSHTCPGGHSWYLESSDSDSVTVTCYTPDDPPDSPDLTK